MSPSFRSALLAAAATFAVGAGFSTPAAACSDTPYIGDVCYMVSQFCPYAYLEANGALLEIREYQALYSLVGVTFGGDGRNTFGIPNLRGRNPVGWGAVTGMTTVNYGQYVGQESVKLQPLQMAPHNHPATFTPNTDTTQGKFTVVTTAIPGSMGVTASLPLVTSATGTATTTPGPVAGNENYLGAVTATVKPASIAYPTNFIGLFSTSTTTPTGGATSPVTTSVTGSPAIPAFSFAVPTGGNVTVGANISANQQIATPVRDPAVGLTACIAVNGTYPTRNN